MRRRTIISPVCLIETRFTTLAFRSRSKRQELFSQVGQVKKAGLNFDQNGRSKGTAEVILARRQDAMQAIKTYNGVKLDGRPLRIELVGGAPGGVTLSSGVTVTGVRGGGARGAGKGGGGSRAAAGKRARGERCDGG